MAQDEAVFMHYTVSPILLNPAAAGFNDAYQLQFNARAAWTGFEDAPKTVAARYNGPIGRTFGLGIGVLSESAAQLSRTQLHLDYAFRLSINEDWKAAFGFFTEFQRMNIDNNVANATFFQAGDALLEDLLNGKGDFDAAVGLYGTFRENTYAGLTFNNLVSSRLDDIAGATGNQESFFSYYTFQLGSKFQTSDAKLSFEPSVLFRQIRNTPFQMDVNLNVGFLQDQLLTGISYRSLGSLGLLLGAKLPSFRLFYSYDLSFQRFQRFNSGSHEVTVMLSLKPRKDKKMEAQQ
jgi:type IX secretion system PorP/SprF family membrane protein